MNISSVSDFIDAELHIRPHQWCDWGTILDRIKTEIEFEGAYCGAYSVTVPKLAVSFVSRKHIWCGEPVSAASIARRILSTGLKIWGKKRIPWNKRVFPLLAVPQPMFCTPLDKLQELYYFDIKSCYFSIYSKMTLDFWFHGNYAHWGDLKFADVLPQDLYKYKICRNSLVGVMRTATSDRVKAGKIQTFPATNSLLSPCHWGFIAHLLHNIALQAKGLDAIYYNTDGAIFKDVNAALKWCDFCKDLGFVTELKARGAGQVSGIGRYQVGDIKVGSFKAKPQAYSNLIQPSDKVVQNWLQMC